MPTPSASQPSPASPRLARRCGQTFCATLATLFLFLLTAPPLCAGTGRSTPPRSTSARPAPSTFGPNLLVNGDFNRGREGWTLEQAPGSARAQLEVLPEPVLPEPLPAGVTGQAARVTVTAVGSEPWHVQLYQSGLDLRERQLYIVAFWARADRQRPITAAANIFGGDGHSVGLYADGLMLGQAWKKFNLAFTATETVAQKNRLTLVLGGSPGTVEVAGCSVRAWDPEERPASNLLKNGDFELAGANWNLEQGGEGSRATLQWPALTDAPAGLTGRAAWVQVDRLGTQPWHVQLVQPALELTEGVPHVVTFWARAEQPRSLRVEAALDMPDWHSVGLSARVLLTSEWQRFRLGFTPTRTVAGHGRLVFVLGESTGRVEIARAYLGKHVLTGPAPQVHPLIGRWSTRGTGSQTAVFTFNADGTGSLQVGASTRASKGAPRTPVANPFRWYLGKDPSDVVIAGRSHRWTLRKAGARDELHLRSAPSRSYLLYRLAPPN